MIEEKGGYFTAAPLVGQIKGGGGPTLAEHG